MANEPFRDRFGAVATDYARFRPTYPDALFDALARLVRRRCAAWDCATGNGQAARSLAARFALVVATDASPAQLTAARPHHGVRYVAARAEAAPLASSSFDLVTIAQALHWLDVGLLWREVRRVLVPGGVVAAWCYTLCRIAPEIDTLVDRYYNVTVGSYWPPERALAETGYRTVAFPFAELDVPAPDMTARLTLPAFLGYVGTWSATEAYRAARGADPLGPLRESLAPLWGPDEARVVRWPLHLRAGRV